MQKMMLYLNSQGQLAAEDGVSLPGRTSDRPSPHHFADQDQLSASCHRPMHYRLYSLTFSLSVIICPIHH